jgi:hypothetical protein
MLQSAGLSPTGGGGFGSAWTAWRGRFGGGCAASSAVDAIGGLAG